MRAQDRYTDAGTVDTQLIVMENFSSFILHLHFFAGVSHFIKTADLRNQIADDRMLKYFWLTDFFIVGHFFHLCVQFANTADTGTADRLICRNDHALCVIKPMQRRQCNQSDDRRAVWIGNDAVMGKGVLRIDFRNDQRDIRIQTVCAAVVDDNSSFFGCSGQKTFGNIIFGCPKDNINIVKALFCCFFDRDRLSLKVQRFAGTAAAG